MAIKRAYIEITNNCNLNCSFCHKNTRPAHFMTIVEFEHIIKQIRPFTSFLYLHVQGEPLLHPQLDALLDMCDQYQMQVQLVTNGTLIHKYPDLYKHSALRKISFSLHSIDQQEMDIDRYFAPIYQFINAATNTFIELRFWNRNDMKAKSLAIFEKIQKLYDMQATKKKDSYKLTSNIYLYFQDEFEWPAKAQNVDHDGYCYAANNMIAILSNGQVTLCCLDANGEINLGNIFKQDLNTILQSSKYLQ
ncbi:MAG: radical SAM protein, partial [Erysipelotrichaceae bacterium]|nr:radical SAM protein [Erysipelotrichaceae bacterium]